MTNKPSALDLIGKAAVKNEAPQQVGRKIVTQVSGALLSHNAPRKPEPRKEGCAFRTIRNLPNDSKTRFDSVVAGGLFRESFNQYMLDAIREKLERDEKALAKKAKAATK